MTSENTLHLTISSVSENVYDGAARSVTVPGSAGEMTILPNHEALVSTLKAGKITVHVAGSADKEFHIDSGVVETSGARTIVLI